MESNLHSQKMSEAEDRRYIRNEVTLLREEMRDVHRKMDHVCQTLAMLTGPKAPQPPTPLQRVSVSGSLPSTPQGCVPPPVLVPRS